MKLKRVSYLLLLAGVIAALGVLVLAAVYAPLAAGSAREMYPEYAVLYWPGLIGVWLIAGMFLLGLYEYFRVCLRIGRDQSFCRENVQSLWRIAVYMAVLAGLWAAAIFAPGLVFQLDIGPIWLVFFLAGMACAALSLLAYGLSRLLRRAVEIKEENDLTV